MSVNLEEDKNNIISEENNQQFDQVVENTVTDEQDLDNANEQVREEIEFTKPDPNGFFAETKSEKACSVAVAVRVRPLIGRELVANEHICVECKERDNNIIIGKERSFKFDRVFDQECDQDEIYDVCTKNLILG